MANAQAGRNLDILELARLTVPIRINQGGHGSTDAKQGLTNLIVNAAGVPFKDTDFSGTLKQDTLTANRTWTLPDATGTIALTSGVLSQVKQQVFTESGTYTPTSGMLYAIVKAVGGGGGGGGSSASFYGGGGGGGGGETAEKVLSASDIGTSQTVTIGAGGTATTAGGGGTGGDTSLGTFVVAKGGFGGNNGATSGAAANGGSGGFGGTGDVLITGETGGVGIGAASNVCQGGNGGNSTTGFGAPLNCAATTITSGGGFSGVGYGSGGSGAVQVTSGSTFAGGVGKAGILIVTEFIAT